MENVKLNVCIDRYSTGDPELEKWTAFVEKYLVYGLKQKGTEVNIVESFSTEETASDYLHLYVPVFTQSALASSVYRARVQEMNKHTGLPNCIQIGLIKESAALEESETLFPDMKLLRMYLIDTDTGMEINDKDVWKKDNFNFFLFKIFDLCNEVERELKSVSEKGADLTTKAVYLAEASPDLIAVREEVRRELLRQGFEVYPERSIGGTAKEVEKTIQAYLQKSALSVHLFGKLYQEPKAGESSRAELENRLAANFFLTKKENKKSSSVFKRVIWTPDNLVVNHEKQEKLLSQVHRDKKLYAGADIIRSSVEELKDILLEKLNEEEPTNGNSGAGSEGEDDRTKNVYIVISEKNKEKGQAIKEMVETYGRTVLMNDGHKISEKDNLRKCNSVLFYYQNENPAWLRSKLCEAFKHKSWEFNSTFIRRGIITFENQELPGDDIFKEIVHIRAQQKLEHENLLTFFNKAH